MHYKKKGFFWQDRRCKQINELLLKRKLLLPNPNYLCVCIHMCTHTQTHKCMFPCIFIILHSAYLPRREEWLPESTWLMSATIRIRTKLYHESKIERDPRQPWNQRSGPIDLICLVPQAALSIHGMCGGPMLGLFSLGIMFPFVNWKVRILCVSLWFPATTEAQLVGMSAGCYM